MFFRMETDGVKAPVNLRDLYGGPGGTTCWIIGGGPSLGSAPCESIQRSPVVKFGVNLSGHGLIRPDLWTAYDPTSRFHRSIYLDGSIVKLLATRRSMDLVPGSTFKVCECPNVLFFERDSQRGFHDFPPSRAGDRDGVAPGVADWQDSLVQAIELAWWLGFRRLLLVGCEMRIRPEPAQAQLALRRGVEEKPGELLKTFVDRCRGAGISAQQLERCAVSRPYHFEETKSLSAAIGADGHYFRVVQYLRLSRRAMSLAGLQLISATPGSRLNEFFPFRDADDLLQDVLDAVGCPSTETTMGKYSTPRPSHAPSASMRDFRPHNWPAGVRRAPIRPSSETVDGDVTGVTVERERRRARAREAVANLPEVAIGLDEIG